MGLGALGAVDHSPAVHGIGRNRHVQVGHRGRGQAIHRRERDPRGTVPGLGVVPAGPVSCQVDFGPYENDPVPVLVGLT